MQTQIITKRDDLLVRRLVLEPGEAMPWHRDTCHRFSVSTCQETESGKNLSASSNRAGH